MRKCILIALLLVPVCGYCGEKVILTGPAVFESCPMMLMAEDDVFSEIGLEVLFRPWNSPDQYRALFSSGESVYAVVSTLEYVRLSETLSGIGLLYNLAGSPLWIMGGKKNVELGDLQNAVVALPFRGDMPEVMLKMLIAGSGIDYNTMKIVSAGGGIPSAQLVMTGRADYVMLPDPIASSVQEISRNRKGLSPLEKSISVDELWRKEYTSDPPLLLSNIISYNTDGKSEQVFYRLYRKYYELCRTEPNKAAEVFLRYFPAMQQNNTALMFRNHKGTLHRAGDVKADFDAFIKLMQEQIDGGF